MANESDPKNAGCMKSDRGHTMTGSFDFQTTEEGRRFEEEIMILLSSEKKDYPNYFGGLKIASGREFRIESPIDPTIQYGIFQEPDGGTMEEAVTAALRAFDSWGARPIEERMAFFQALPGVLRSRRLHYAAAITVASGMVREDALAEVDAAADAIERVLGEAKAIGRRRPQGVWAVITAHNSPFASPISYAVAAMVAGNTVVMNPCKYTSMLIHLFYGLMEKYGLPAGVLNLIVDSRDDSTQELANDMRLAGIVASGSGDRMEDLMFLQVDDEVHFINELKGMNPAVVCRPSDMKGAVREIMESAFGYSGQGLFACSKVIILREDQAKFTGLLAENMKGLRIDDPVNDTAFSGPLICAKDAERFRETALRLMPFTVAKAMPVPDGLPENYVSPIAVCGVDPEDEINYMDSGLPILNITAVDSVEDIFTELEDCECGLSAGIFTKDAKLIDRFRKEVDVPQMFINEGSRSLRPASGAVLEKFVE